MKAPERRRPLLVGLGDSWFDYFALDLFDRLEEHPGLEVLSLAHAGTRLASMQVDPAQLLALDSLLAQGREPAAILLSVGGNDVVNDVLAGLLEPAAAAEPDKVRWRQAARDQRIHVEMARQLKQLLDTLITLCDRHLPRRPVPLLLHGYDHPYPDGRGTMGTGWSTWLAPAFGQHGYAFGPATIAAMRELIDELNRMQASVAQGFGARVQNVDLTGTLPTTRANYQRYWGNELHPTPEGFRLLAARLLDAVQQVGVKPLPLPLLE